MVSLLLGSSVCSRDQMPVLRETGGSVLLAENIGHSSEAVSSQPRAQTLALRDRGRGSEPLTGRFAKFS